VASNKASEDTPHPHCMGKSAEVIEGKGVVMAPLRKKSAQLHEKKGDGSCADPSHELGASPSTSLRVKRSAQLTDNKGDRSRAHPSHELGAGPSTSLRVKKSAQLNEKKRNR